MLNRWLTYDSMMGSSTKQIISALTVHVFSVETKFHALQILILNTWFKSIVLIESRLNISQGDKSGF